MGADLPNAAEHRPPTPPGTGTPATRTARDDLRHAAFRHALREFAKEVRRHDPHRPIFSGNAFPRPSAWHQMHSRTWDRDTRSQWVEMLQGDNPEPMDAVSGRLYGDEDLGLLDWASESARSSRRPLFVGEFGVTGPPTDAALDRLRGMLDALESRGVPLAALWVYDFDGQRATWNVTTENERSRILSLVAERQAAWAGKEGSGRGVDGAAGAGATVEGGAKRVP
ncbi:MAG: hypothetical protein JNL97_08215 [Verrucomicrobiales bacterium]|nr:hypothetical protein [Verrucomicrobiales bacterium]